MAVQPSVKSYLGLALETTKGTAVTATDFVPITLNSFKPVEMINELLDKGIRGSMVENYNYVQGRRHTEIDFGGPVFADTIGYWLAGVLGDVTNKLILDSDSQDDRTRLRALELLGKISDVGLFVEKSEVTITHRSTQDLVDSVRAKIHKLMNPQGIEDVKAVEVNGETFDLEEELGVSEEKPDANADE